MQRFFSLGLSLLIAWTAVLLAGTARADYATYSGTLTYWQIASGPTDEIYVPGGGVWGRSNVTISWTVTNADTSHAEEDLPWKYTYTFGHTGNGAGISHLVLETASDSQASDFELVSGSDPVSFSGANPTLQREQSGCPGMPEDVWGLRFAPPGGSGLTTMTWTFFSNRAPTWGDFYAKDGNQVNIAYNLGFTANDVDPNAAVDDGSYLNHLLVPGALSGPLPDPVNTPEPSAVVALLGMGVGFVAIRPWRRRRRADAVQA